MKYTVALTLAAALVASPVLAAGTPQEERQLTMKSVGQAMGTLAKTAKGEINYDAAAVAKAFQTMNDATKNFVEKFPEGTETGHDTEASPKIWSDRTGFESAVDKFGNDTSNAVAAAPQDLDAFKVQFGKVAKNCSTCHEAYRVKKN